MQYMFCITALYLLKVCHIQFAYSSLHVDIFAGFRNIRQDTADQQRPERAQTLTSKSALCCTIGISTWPVRQVFNISPRLIGGNVLPGEDVPPEYIPRIYHSYTLRIPFIF